MRVDFRLLSDFALVLGVVHAAFLASTSPVAVRLECSVAGVFLGPQRVLGGFFTCSHHGHDLGLISLLLCRDFPVC